MQAQNLQFSRPLSLVFAVSSNVTYCIVRGDVEQSAMLLLVILCLFVVSGRTKVPESLRLRSNTFTFACLSDE